MVGGPTRQRAGWALCAALLVAWGPRLVRAEDGRPASVAYEDERTAKVLEGLGRAVEAEPTGKRIRELVFVGHDVFVADEVWPTFPNAFHTQTRQAVVARELLFQAGDAWDSAVVDETARALRAQGIFTLVQIIPLSIPGDAANIDVLIFTRDLWSLRLETAFTLTGDLLSTLDITLIERNLAGDNYQAALGLSLDPGAWMLGQSFANPRLFGSRWALSEEVGLLFGRLGATAAELEGTRGALSLGLPLWDLRPRYGVTLSASWDVSVRRQLSGAELLTWDDPLKPGDDAHARIWRQRTVNVNLQGGRQWGSGWTRQRLYFGYAAAVSEHEALGSWVDLAARARFDAAVLPPSRRELYPWLRWQLFTTDWVVFHELGAYGVTEDVRTGPALDFAFGAPLKAFGSTEDALTFEGAMGWVWAPEVLGDRALLDAKVVGSMRLQGGRLIDRVLRVRLRGASPRFSTGRGVLSADLLLRGGDSAQTLVALGADNGLRGYASQAFYAFGGDRLRVNAEWRSPPWVLGSLHVGGVAFYDVGGVADRVEAIDLHHSAGLGLRVLIPQFNRAVFRMDLALSLDSGAPSLLFSFGSGQLVPMTATEDERRSD